MAFAAVNDSLSKATRLIAMVGRVNKLGYSTSEISVNIPKSPSIVPLEITLAELIKFSKLPRPSSLRQY